MKTRISPTRNLGAGILKFASITLLIIFEIVLIWPENLLAKPNSPDRPYYHLPPEMKKGDLVFAGSRIPLERHEVKARIEEQINYLLMDRRATLWEVLERMSSVGPLISATLSEEKLPVDLLYLSASLSDLSATSKTKSGGQGWWNLGSLKNSGQSWSTSNEWDDRRDPVISTKLASGIFNQLRAKNPKFDWLFSIAAFVDGPDKIEHILKKNPGFGFWDVLAPTFSETIVPRMIALKIINDNRKYFDVEITPPPLIAFDLIDKQKLSKDLPLRTLSQWTGQTPRELWELNPGVDPAFGGFVKFDRRYPYATFMRIPKGSGRKVKESLDSEGFTKN